MTGVQPGLFGRRATLSILACTLAMALVARVVAQILVQQVVKIQRREKIQIPHSARLSTFGQDQRTAKHVCFSLTSATFGRPCDEAH